MFMIGSLHHVGPGIEVRSSSLVANLSTPMGSSSKPVLVCTTVTDDYAWIIHNAHFPQCLFLTVWTLQMPASCCDLLAAAPSGCGWTPTPSDGGAPCGLVTFFLPSQLSAFHPFCPAFLNLSGGGGGGGRMLEMSSQQLLQFSDQFLSPLQREASPTRIGGQFFEGCSPGPLTAAMCSFLSPSLTSGRKGMFHQLRRSEQWGCDRTGLQAQREAAPWALSSWECI